MGKFREIELGFLKKAPWNYKLDSPELIQKLKSNIERNGFIENIVVRELEDGFFEVVNGNHRLQALIDMNGPNFAMCCDLGKISEAQAKRIAVELNETKFDADQVELSKVIDSLVEEFGLEDLSQTMPYSQTEIQNMRDSLDFDWKENRPPEKKKSKKDGEVISCTKEQLEIIREAIAALKESEQDESMNEGRCLELICADYLAGRKVGDS